METSPGSPTSRPRPAIPERFGKYFILRELGRGGMGVIYEALDQELNRKVALKLMLAAPGTAGESAEEEEGRFVREAQLAAKLKHPNIVSIYESGILEGKRYIAMELVEGNDLAAWRNDGVPLPRQIEILRDVALAVHHAHQHGVLHRDLKPYNILITPQGHMVITDFGLAKGVGSQAALSLTGSGSVVGTPAYMSPEQAQGKKDLDARTDVYSMGVILYEALAGRPPFQGDSAVDLLLKAVKDPLPPPSSIRKAPDRTIENICLKALSRNRDGRYSSAEEFAADLTRWLSGSRFRVPVAREKSLRPWIYTALALVAVALWATAFKAGRHRAVDGPPSRPVKPPAPPSSGDFWSQAIDLLPLVDVERDALSGAWSRKEGDLWVESGAPARLQIPYRPPDEYDLRLTFTRRSGEYCVNLILTRQGAPFLWVMEPAGRYGFERVQGHDFLKNATTVLDGPRFDSGRPHVAVVNVRRDGLRAFLDGRLVREWKTDYSDLSMNPGWGLRDPGCLGMGVWQSATTFHRLEVREVSGKGVVTRVSPSRSIRK